MPLDRRRFLTETGRATAGAALGMTALAGRSFPAEAKRRASPNDTIVCALIGGGGRGNYLMNLAAREEDVALTTICDANRQNLARTAASLGKIQERKVKQVGDFRHLLDDKSLGAKEEEGPGMRGGAGGEEHVRNFLDCVRNGNPANAHAGIAHLSCGVVHLGEIAYRTGRVLRFDPKTEQFPGDEEANALLTKKHRAPWAFDS